MGGFDSKVLAAKRLNSPFLDTPKYQILAIATYIPNVVASHLHVPSLIHSIHVYPCTVHLNSDQSHLPFYCLDWVVEIAS